jgi:hypothetical protein
MELDSELAGTGGNEHPIVFQMMGFLREEVLVLSRGERFLLQNYEIYHMAVVLRFYVAFAQHSHDILNV